MADSIRVSVDEAAVNRDVEQLNRNVLVAGRAAVETATKRLERKIEAATQSAAPGNAYKAWGSRVYPTRGRLSNNPAGVIIPNGGARSHGLLTFWTQPGSASRGGGKYYAVPLPAAGKPPRGTRPYQMTPEMWESAHNTDLEFVPRPGKAPLLVAQTGTITVRGTFRRDSVRRLKAGRSGRTWVPMFVLIPVIRFRGSVSIVSLVDEAERSMVADFISAVNGAG